MKKTLIISFLIIVVGLSSCINCLNPLVTYNNAVNFDATTGLWQDDGGNSIKIEKFRGSELDRELNKDTGKNGQKSKPPSEEEMKYQNNVYVLSFIKNQVQHVMFLSFARINNNLFAQFAPLFAFEKNKNSYNEGLVIKNDTSNRTVWEFGKDQTFSFAKVKMNAGQLQFTPLDEDYMQDLLDKGAISIPFENDDWFSSTLITASTDQLEKFFYKYGNYERVFNKKHTLVFKPTAL